MKKLLLIAIALLAMNSCTNSFSPVSSQEDETEIAQDSLKLSIEFLEGTWTVDLSDWHVEILDSITYIFNANSLCEQIIHTKDKDIKYNGHFLVTDSTNIYISYYKCSEKPIFSSSEHITLKIKNLNEINYQGGKQILYRK